MRKLLALIATAALAATAQASTPRGEDQLARALRGRVAGEPVSCINLHRATQSRVINDTAILWRVGSTLYVNRPRAGADALNQWDTMIVRLPVGQLCSVDTVHMVDLHSHMLTGIVFLGEFVPYRRVGRNTD
jgi:hypothetical protein